MLLLTAVLLSLAVPSSARLVSPEQRRDAVSRARVRDASVDPSKRDALNGPQGPGSYAFGQEVRCKYEEKDPKKPIGGHSKKFPCHDAAGERLKVKYDPESNNEIFGEVAATRLFWALGFYAERMYTVKVVCENCPADPYKSDAPPRATRTFEPATIQKRLEGEELSEVADEGWRIPELDSLPSRAEADALKLLLVLVRHGDNTANQQRLLCAPDDAKCERPIMYVTDLGGTFGGRDNATSYRAWARQPVWKDKAACVAAFEGADKQFRDPEISEEGRALLAGLLGKLSDKQIGDLFRAGRFDILARREPMIAPNGGKPRRPTIADWTELFKRKRAEIASARCPS